MSDKLIKCDYRQPTWMTDSKKMNQKNVEN